MVATVGDDAEVRQPTVVAEREAQGLDVIVQPGSASYANFTAGSGGDVIATPGRTETPQGVYWDVVLPPITLFMGLGGRAAWIAVTPRRLDVVQVQMPRLSDEALARAVRGAKPSRAAGCGEPWLEGIARRMEIICVSSTAPSGDARALTHATGAGPLLSQDLACALRGPGPALRVGCGDAWLGGIAYRMGRQDGVTSPATTAMLAVPGLATAVDEAGQTPGAPGDGQAVGWLEGVAQRIADEGTKA